jgi:hypothetical protein
MTDRRDLHRKRILPPPEPAHKISSLVIAAASANAGTANAATVTASAEAIRAAAEVLLAFLLCSEVVFGWLLDT